MKRLLAALLAAVATFAALAPNSANAAATQTAGPLASTTWTDLGAGPLRLFASGSNTRYAIADTAPAPTDTGFAVGDTPIDVSTTSHVWVRSTSPLSSAFATYAPLNAGGTGGGPATISDGSDVALGTTTDAATANTLIGLNKAEKASLALGATAAAQATAQTSLSATAASVALNATAANQTNGAHKTQLVDSANANQFTAGNPGFVNGGTVQADHSVPINVSTAITTQLVALVAGKVINVMAWDAIANGTTNLTFEYGTGTNCAAGTTALTGPYGLVAQFGLTKGSGIGPLLFVPAGNALCAVNSAAVQVSGSLAYTQF